MSAPDLEEALAAVPFLAPLGVGVEAAAPGSVILRLPADKRTRDFDGYVASGALFAVGELAATVALATHPALSGRTLLRRRATIAYREPTNRPVRARATVDAAALGTLDPEDPTVAVTAELLGRGDAPVAIVTATFAIPPR